MSTPEPTLRIEMYAEPDPAATSCTTHLHAQVSNRGPDDATGVTVTDTFRREVTFDSASAGCAHASGTVTCAVGPVARVDTVGAGDHGDHSVLRPARSTNTASVDGNEPDPDTDEQHESRSRHSFGTPADLGVAVADSPDPIATGGTLTYTTIVTNNGPGVAPAVAMSQVLHPRTMFDSATSTNGTCSEESGTVTCDVGTLANGASATITITVTKTNPGVISSVATVFGDVGDTEP